MTVESLPSVDEIAATLAAWDVPYLMASEVVPPLDVTASELISILASNDNPRVNEALIPFFLKFPEHYQHIITLNALSELSSSRLLWYYTAAVYLQRFWQPTLTLYLGSYKPLPNLFGKQFKLAPTEVHWGELGLRQLAAHLEAKDGSDWRSTFEGAAERYLHYLQVKAEHELSYA